MEFENDNFSVIIPDYLINSDQETSDQETSDQETSDQETSDQETSDQETSDQETSDQETSVQIDYSSILLEMNTRLENIETSTQDYKEGINGLLANLYFIDFVAFAVFVFLMLFIVIKFFKTFF